MQLILQTVSHGKGRVLLCCFGTEDLIAMVQLTVLRRTLQSATLIPDDQDVPVFSVFPILWFQLQEKTGYRNAELSAFWAAGAFNMSCNSAVSICFVPSLCKKSSNHKKQKRKTNQ